MERIVLPIQRDGFSERGHPLLDNVVVLRTEHKRVPAGMGQLKH